MSDSNQRAIAWTVRPGSGNARIEPVDFAYWRRFYPNGLGESAFSNPAWQCLMAAEMGSEWSLRFLRIDEPRRLTLPVFVRPARYGRVEITTRPTGYYVTPIEQACLDAAEMSALMAAMATPRVQAFTCWLPPWGETIAGPTEQHWWMGKISVDVDPTWVVPLRHSADEHMRKGASKRHLRDSKSSRKRGLEVVTSPNHAQRRAYAQLYHEIHRERRWAGERFSETFFHRAAATLGNGGELVVTVLDGEVVGGGLFLFDRHAVHYFQGATRRGLKGVFPHVEMLRHALQTAELRGLQRVNFGGVDDGNESLAKFKRSWGAEPLPVPRLHCVSGPRFVMRLASAAMLGRPGSA